ncbi:MAG: methyltransferase, TrmH family [Acidobacteriota bacterium]|jgi:TrmH family RNA methyltransferase|nr:methyltransferase, TrmH family [Acidobacteriota bacterium]
MKEAITSRKNPLVQRARAVRDGRERELIFVEGVRLCEEALRASVELELALYTQSLADDERGARLIEELRDVCNRVQLVGESVLESVSDTKKPQGIVVLARRPQTGREIIERATGTPLVVVMHSANNPSNAGAMLRVAEAAGASAIIATRGSADLLSAKALRGSMGSALRLPLWPGPSFEEALGWCAGRGIFTVATSASETAVTHTEIDWTMPRAVIVGPEAGGLSDEEARAASQCIRIPMRAPVESLNVATALAVILYEAARQRNFS